MDVGAHCSREGCGVIDFLPVVCDQCGRRFCKDHASYVAHECAEVDGAHDAERAAAPAATGPSVAAIMSGVHSRRAEAAAERERSCGVTRADTPSSRLLAATRASATAGRQNAGGWRLTKGDRTALSPVASASPAQRAGAERAMRVRLAKLSGRAAKAPAAPLRSRVLLEVVHCEEQGADAAGGGAEAAGTAAGVQRRVEPQGSVVIAADPGWSVGRLLDAAANVAGVRNDNSTCDAAGMLRLVPWHPGLAEPVACLPQGGSVSGLLDAGAVAAGGLLALVRGAETDTWA